jgi:hypothetical protein
MRNFSLFLRSKQFYRLHWLAVAVVAVTSLALMGLDAGRSTNGPAALWIPFFVLEFPCLGVMMVLDPVGKYFDNHFIQRLFNFVLSPFFVFGLLGPSWLRFCFRPRDLAVKE